MRGLYPVLIMMTSAASFAFPESSGAVPSLLTHSPFLPPGFQPPGGSVVTAEVPVSSSQFEFHGVYQLGGKYFFNLYNKREQRGNWLNRGETVDGFPKVIRFDEDTNLLTVEVAGEQVSLQLIDTDDTPVPLATGAAPRQAAPPAPAGTSPRPTPVRRRVIRPTSRTSRDSETRRPVIRPSSQEQ